MGGFPELTPPELLKFTMRALDESLADEHDDLVAKQNEWNASAAAMTALDKQLEDVRGKKAKLAAKVEVFKDFERLDREVRLLGVHSLKLERDQKVKEAEKEEADSKREKDELTRINETLPVLMSTAAAAKAKANKSKADAEETNLARKQALGFVTQQSERMVGGRVGGGRLRAHCSVTAFHAAQCTAAAPLALRMANSHPTVLLPPPSLCCSKSRATTLTRCRPRT